MERFSEESRCYVQEPEKVLEEVETPAAEGEQEKREKCSYEYRDTEGRIIRAVVEFEIVDSGPEKSAFKQALMANGSDEMGARIYANDQFAHETVEILCSFVLTGEDGVNIDVLAECKLKERRIYTRKDMQGMVVPGYNVFFTPGLHTAIGALLFLHEYGHVEQLQDEQFMEWYNSFPSDSPRRRESSPRAAAAEFNANERLVERVLAWRQRGVDLMGTYPIDLEDDLMKRILQIPQGEDIQQAIRHKKAMSLDQLLRLQLLERCLSEREL